MIVMIQLCDFKDTRHVIKSFSDLYAARSMFRTMLEMEPDMNETFALCKLFGKRIDCKDIFFPILTDGGFCYAFNTVRMPDFLTDE